MLLPRAGGERLQRAQSFPKAAAHGQKPPKANSVGCTCLSPLLCLFCAGLCDAIPGNELSHHPAACPSPFPPLLRGAAGAQDNTLTRWGGGCGFWSLSVQNLRFRGGRTRRSLCCCPSIPTPPATVDVFPSPGLCLPISRMGSRGFITSNVLSWLPSHLWQSFFFIANFVECPAVSSTASFHFGIIANFLFHGLNLSLL